MLFDGFFRALREGRIYITIWVLMAVLGTIGGSSANYIYPVILVVSSFAFCTALYDGYVSPKERYCSLILAAICVLIFVFSKVSILFLILIMFVQYLAGNFVRIIRQNAQGGGRPKF